MNRRKFIQQGLVLSAGAILPSPILPQSSTSCLKTFEGDNSWDTQLTSSFRTSVRITLCTDDLTNFSSTTKKQLSLLLFKTDTKGENAVLWYEASYDITSSKEQKRKADVKFPQLFDVLAKRAAIQKNASDLPTELDWKNIKFTFKVNDKMPYQSIDLLEKNADVFMELQPEVDEECFLTTACVKYFGKNDNCEELQTLRQFRDEVLLQSTQGRALVAEYYNIAPQIVRRLNASKKAGETYAGIYNNMIQPTMQHIAAHNNQMAIEVYKNYVLKLKSAFL